MVILKRVHLALLLVLLTCVVPRLRHPTLPTYPADFNVYYCAATLVRQGQGALIYRGADTGTDPQKALAAPGSPMYEVAHAHGLPYVGLYVYPPVLADMMVPFARLDLPTATHLWLATGLACLVATALLLAAMMGWHVLSWQTALVCLAVLCFTPALQGLVDGQITVCLLLLWAAGMFFYQRDQEVASGVLFALATAIKLTPAIVLLPFLLWRKGRLLGAFCGTIVALVALTGWVNSPAAWDTYVSRVMPAMSGALPVYSNYALPASVQRLLLLLRTGTVAPFPEGVPQGVVRAGRLSSVVAGAGLAALLWRARAQMDRQQQLRVLALLSLLAPVLSPVSWFHAYTTAFVAFAFLWRAAMLREPGWGVLVLLTGVTLLLGSAVAENLIPRLLFAGHDAWAAVLHTGGLGAALALVYQQLWQMGAAGDQRRVA